MNTYMNETLAERYSRATALRHERLYGRGYQGPGRESVFRALADRLNLRPGMSVLDVGCGLGGDVFRLANAFDVHVVGLDAAPDMVAVARERTATDAVDPARVEFVLGNVLDSDLVGSTSFDVVWSRDAGAFLEPAAKLAAWERLLAAQPAGGQVLVTDYCIGASNVTDDFRARMIAWGQHMITLEEYAGVLASAGYSEIQVDDRTEDLIESQLDGLSELEVQRDELLVELGEEHYTGLVDRWKAKIGHSSSGQLAWMVLTATVAVKSSKTG